MECGHAQYGKYQLVDHMTNEYVLDQGIEKKKAFKCYFTKEKAMAWTHLERRKSC